MCDIAIRKIKVRDATVNGTSVNKEVLVQRV